MFWTLLIDIFFLHNERENQSILLFASATKGTMLFDRPEIIFCKFVLLA